MSAKTGAERARLSRERKEADYKAAIEIIVKRDNKIEELHAKVAEYDNILSQETKALNYTKAELGKKESKIISLQLGLNAINSVCARQLVVHADLMREAGKHRTAAKRWRNLAGTGVMLVLALFVIVFLLNRENKTLEAKYELAIDSLQFMSNATDLAVKHNQWHTETPPVEVKLSVVTYAWYNDKGEWQSYSNGSVIDVLEWRPE